MKIFLANMNSTTKEIITMQSASLPEKKLGGKNDLKRSQKLDNLSDQASSFEDFNSNLIVMPRSRMKTEVPSPERIINRFLKKEIPFAVRDERNREFRDDFEYLVEMCCEFYHGETEQEFDVTQSKKILFYLRADGIINGVKFIFDVKKGVFKKKDIAFEFLDVSCHIENKYIVQLQSMESSSLCTLHLSLMKGQPSRVQKIMVYPQVAHDDVLLRQAERKLKTFFSLSPFADIFEISLPLGSNMNEISDVMRTLFPDKPEMFNLGLMDSLKDCFTSPNLQEMVQSLGKDSLKDLSGQLANTGADIATAIKIAIGCYALSEAIYGHINQSEYQFRRGLKILTALGLFEAALSLINRPQINDLDTIEDADEFIQNGIYSLFTKFTGVFNKLSFPSFKVWSSNIILVDRLTKSVPELCMKILGWFDDFLEWAIGKRCFESLFPNSLGLGTQFANLLEECRVYIQGHRSGELLTDMNSFDVVSNLMTRLDYCILKGDRQHPKFNLVMTIRRDLEDCRKTVLNCIPGLEDLRQEPATTLFLGAPGSYKSSMLARLSKDLQRHIETLENLEYSPKVHQVNPGAKHMDGYSSGTAIITWDEFAQRIDVAGPEENEYSLFMRMVNTIPCALPMAELTSKGTTYCKAKVIIGTTNCLHWNINSLVDPNAVDRRWQKQYIVCPKGQFAKDIGTCPGEDVNPSQRVVDWEKVALHQGIDDLEACNPLEEEMEFFEWERDATGKRSLGARVEYTEILESLKKRMKVKENIFKANALRNKRETKVLKKNLGYDSFDVEMLELTSDMESDYTDSEEDEEEEELDPDTKEAYALIGLNNSSDLASVPVNDITRQKILEHIILHEYFTTTGRIDDFIHRVMNCLKERIKKTRTRFEKVVDSLSDSIKNTEEKISDKIGSNTLVGLKIAVGSLVALGGAMLLGWKMYRAFSPEEKVLGEEVQVPQYAKAERKMDAKKTPLKDIILGNKVSSLMNTDVPQMGHVQDPNGWDIVKKVVTSNQYTMYREAKNSKGETIWIQDGYFLGIKGNVGLVPAHFIIRYEICAEEEPETRLLFLQKRGVIDFAQFLNVKDFLRGVMTMKRNPEIVTDFCLVRVPIGWGHFKDITPKFRSRDVYIRHHEPDLNSCGLVLMNTELKSIDGSTPAIGTLFQCTGNAVYAPKFPVALGGSTRMVGPGMRYNLKTTAGSCGALLIDFNCRVSSEKIVGIHVSGNTQGFGHSMIICREDIEECLSQNEHSSLCEADIPDQVEIGVAPLEGIFEPICAVPKANSNPKSTYKKTWEPFYELLQPCSLYPSDVRSFNISECLRKHNLSYVPVVDLEEYKMSVEAYSDFLMSVSDTKIPSTIWSFEETVYGLELYPSPKLTRTTSPGYPYILSRKKKGKCDWLGDDPDPRTDLPKFQELIEDVNRLKSTILNGERPIRPFMLMKKDELRKIGKVARIFGSGPLDLLVLCMQYFGSFVTWYQSNRIKNGSSLGVNVYSSEWNAIAEHVKNDFVLSCDFANFDNLRNSDLVAGLLQVIEDYYVDSTEEDRKIRAALFLDCLCAYYVHDGFIYRSSNGLPTGHFLTATLNTLFNGAITLHAVFLSFKKKISPKDCLKYYSFMHNGDDCLTGVSAETSVFVNEQTMSEQMALMGCSLTSDKKDGKFYLRTIEEIEYLKRGFRYEESYGLYVAPFNLKRLFEFLNWTRKIDGEMILKTNLEKFLVELSAHDKETFDHYSQIVIKAYRETWGVEPYNKRRHTCLEAFMNTEVLPYGFQGGNTNEEKMISTTTPFPLQAVLSPAYMYDLNSDDFELSSEENQIKFKNEPHVEPDNFQMNVDSQVDMLMENSGTVIQAIQPFRNDKTFVTDASSGAEVAQLTRWIDKPIIISSGSFASTDGATTFTKWDWHRPLDITAIANKYSGNYSIQADLVLTLTCNGNIQQQGLVALVYIPLGGCLEGGAPETSWLKMHCHSVTQITQLPHVKLDINTDTEVKLTIPWHSVTNSHFHATGRTAFSIGKFFLYPLIPISAASGSLTCSFTLYAHYQNVVLTSVSVPQMGTGKKDLLTAEAEGDKNIISRTLRLGADVSGALSKVPILTEFFTPVKWLLDAGSNAAKAWGFSKPNTLEPPTRVLRSLYAGMANCDSTEVSENLALSISNHTSIEQGNCGNIDELAITGIIQRYSWTYTATWPKTLADGDALISFSVDPRLYTNTTDSSATLLNFTPLGFVSTMFNHWRGDLIFKFHFVKTKFHSGRVLLYFEPVVPNIGAYTLPSLTNSYYCSRVVLDIKEMNIAEIRVPYVNIAPWTRCGNNIGYLHMVVLDELVAPDTVSNTIKIFCEVKAAENFEFNAPGANYFGLVPFTPDTYQMGELTENSEDTSLQVSMATSDLKEVCDVTHGQKVTSLRQMVKRAQYIVANTLTGSSTTTNYLYPFSSFIYQGNGGVVNGTSTTVTRDLFTKLSCIYLYSRGGVRVRPLMTTVSSSQAYTWRLDFNTDTSVTAFLTSQAISINKWCYESDSNAICYSQGSVPLSSITVPQHTMGLSRLSVNNIFTTLIPLNLANQFTSTSRLGFRQDGASPPALQLMREGADDINFACFTSIPPMYADTVA